MLHDTKKQLHYFLGYLRAVKHKALVLEPAKTVYIPIPKAANSSITLALYPTLNLPTPTVPEMRVDRNLRYTSVEEALKLAGQDWFIFSVVRDPISRSMSAYMNKVVNRTPIFPPCSTMGVQPGDSYGAFIQKCRRWPPGILNDHFQPQSTLLKHALRDKRFRYFKFEKLKNDWKTVCDQIEARCGIRLSGLPQVNVSKGYQFELSEQTLDQTYRFYRRDFRTFAYDNNF